ncbi:MAG: hypothetical protein ACYDCG_15190 [Candidatus Acidiferrales bacterium]
MGWIDHAIGVGMAQWFTFEALPSEGTRVHTCGEIVHSGMTIAGRTVEELVASLTRTCYESIRLACNQLVLPGGVAPGDASFTTH